MQSRPTYRSFETHSKDQIESLALKTGKHQKHIQIFMTSAFNPYVAILYALGPPLGFFVVGGILTFIRRTIRSDRSAFKPVDFWLGTVERYVALALFVWQPASLPWFIGAWVGLKFAANWKRETRADAAQGSLIFLVGNVLSFSFAIGVAMVAQLLSFLS